MNCESLARDFDAELRKRNAPACSFIDSPGRGRIYNEGYHENKLHIQKARGCYVEDCLGNRYIDTALGAGTHLLGHAHPVVVAAVTEQVQDGSLYINPNLQAYQLAERLAAVFPSMDGFVFCNSGSEATMRAARIARAHTGRRKVAVFSGSWHGGQDLLLVEDDYDSDAADPRGKLKSAGVPEQVRELTVMLPFNHQAAFDLIKKHRDELAMVIVEPSQGSNPRDDIQGFLQELRRVTEEHRILLCFDEMITGFRIALGGGQQYWGVVPDLATYGKTLGGGLPFGMLAGKRDIFDTIRGPDSALPVFMGGTFSANPLLTHVGLKLLAHLVEHEEAVYGELNRRGGLLRAEVNRGYQACGIPLRMIGVGSFLRLLFTDAPVSSRRDRDRLELPARLQKLFFNYLLLHKGININSSGVIFLSTQHDDQITGELIAGFLAAGSFFKDALVGEGGGRS